MPELDFSEYYTAPEEPEMEPLDLSEYYDDPGKLDIDLLAPSASTKKPEPKEKFEPEADSTVGAVAGALSNAFKKAFSSEQFFRRENIPGVREAMLIGETELGGRLYKSIASFADKATDTGLVPIASQVRAFNDSEYGKELIAAAAGGVDTMQSGLLGTGFIAGVVTEEQLAASLVETMRNVPETPEYYRKFVAEIGKEGRDVSEAEGAWDTTIEVFGLLGNTMLEAVKNPKAVPYMITESLASSVPAIALGAGGTAGGAAVGTATAGPAGTVAGGIAGLAAGTALGTFSVEAGIHLNGLVQEELGRQGKTFKEVTEADIMMVLQSKDFLEWAEGESIKRGLAVAAVEGVFAMFGGQLISGARKTAVSQALRGAADVGVETIGEMSGELAGQMVTEGDIDPAAVVMEGIAGLGQSAGTTATGAMLRGGAASTSQDVQPPPTTDLPTTPGTGVGDVLPGTGDRVGDSLDQAISDTGGSALPGEDSLDATIRETGTSKGAAVDNLEKTRVDNFAAEEATFLAEEKIRLAELDILASPPKTLEEIMKEDVDLTLAFASDRAFEAGFIGDELHDQMYEEGKKLPISLRSDSMASFMDTYEKMDRTIGEEMRRGSASIVDPIDVMLDLPPEMVLDAQYSMPEGLLGDSDIDSMKTFEEYERLEGLEVPEGIPETMDEIDAVAAKESPLSPYNDMDKPSGADMMRGWYHKPKVVVSGLTISLENPVDSVREGTDKEGKKWSVKLVDHYGEIPGTKGMDGDPIDVFIGPKDGSRNVFVVDQKDPTTGEFDEHKVIVGASNLKEAKEIYNRNYEDGWQGMMGIVKMKPNEFKEWVKDPLKTSRPAAQFKEDVSSQEEVGSVEMVDSVSEVTETKGARNMRAVVSIARPEVLAEDGTVKEKASPGTEIAIIKRDGENWTVDNSKTPTMPDPKDRADYAKFKKDFDKKFPATADQKKHRKARKEVMKIRMELSAETSSRQAVEGMELEMYTQAELETNYRRAEHKFNSDPNMSRKRDLYAAKKALGEQQEANLKARENSPHFKKYNDRIDKLVAKGIGKSKADMTISERIGNAISSTVGRMNPMTLWGNITTDVYAIELAEKKMFGKRLSTEESPTALTHLARNAKVAAGAAMNFNAPKLDKHGTGLIADESVAPLHAALDPIAKMGARETVIWEAWILSFRYQRLLEEGKVTPWTSEEVKEIQSWVAAKPEMAKQFQDSLDIWKKFNRANLQLAVDSGSINEQDAFGGFVIFVPNKKGKGRMVKGKRVKGAYVYQSNATLFVDQESASVAAEAQGLEDYEVQAVDGWYHDDYVPANRVMGNENTGPVARRKIGDQKSLIKRLKGGTERVLVIENMVQNTTAIISHVMSTIAMRETVAMLDGVAVEKIAQSDDVPALASKETLAAMLADQDIDVTEMSEPEVRRWQRMLQASDRVDSNTVVVFEKGRPVHYNVMDPALLSAIKQIGPKQAALWLKVIGFPTKVISYTITKMPGFILRNSVRDTQQAYIMNNNASLAAVGVIMDAAKNMAKLSVNGQKELASMMMRGAVSHDNYFNAVPTGVIKRMRKRSRGIVSKYTLGSAEAVYGAYNAIGVASEQANRLSIRDAALESGATQAEAEYQALDWLNHSRRGQGPILDVMLAVIPFLNPRIQGMDRLMRGFKESKASYTMKIGLMMAATTALAAWNWDENEEEMDKLSEVEKDLYTHFWVDGDHYRIPKGFEIGQIAGTFPERVVEQIMTEQPEHVSDTFRRFMKTTFGLSHGQIYRPVLEASMDYDTFRERQITSFADQFGSPEEQYDAYTSEIAKWIAQTMPDSAPEMVRSPKMVDHLIKGYTGTMGAWTLQQADHMYEMTGNAPDAPTKMMGERDMVRNIYRGELQTSSRHIGRFYDMLKQSNDLTSDLKRMKERSIEEWVDSTVANADKMGARKTLNRYSKKFTELNKRRNKTLESYDIDGDEKAEILQEITIQKNRLASEVTDLYWWAFK